jgi:hypothetical protein
MTDLSKYFISSVLAIILYSSLVFGGTSPNFELSVIEMIQLKWPGMDENKQEVIAAAFIDIYDSLKNIEEKSYLKDVGYVLDTYNDLRKTTIEQIRRSFNSGSFRNSAVDEFQNPPTDKERKDLQVKFIFVVTEVSDRLQLWITSAETIAIDKDGGQILIEAIKVLTRLEALFLDVGLLEDEFKSHFSENLLSTLRNHLVNTVKLIEADYISKSLSRTHSVIDFKGLNVKLENVEVVRQRLDQLTERLNTKYFIYKSPFDIRNLFHQFLGVCNTTKNREDVSERLISIHVNHVDSVKDKPESFYLFTGHMNLNFFIENGFINSTQGIDKNNLSE